MSILKIKNQQGQFENIPTIKGDAGEGVPVGGTTGQYLKKKSNADYDTEWADGGSSGTSDYTDLTNKPKVNNVELNGNKSLQDLGIVNFSGNYNDLTNKPTIPTVPTNVSAFTNDAGYVTDAYHDNTKQDALVSGTNIKTINGNSVLGSGNIEIQSGGGGTWGSITGTLSDQTDLNTALTNKVGNDANTNAPIYKVWYGTQAQHEAITTKDTNTLYFTPEE